MLMHPNNHSLLFAIDEYRMRLEAVRSHMRERSVDLLLIDHSEFLFYLTGFAISEAMYRACVIPLEEDPVMILRAIDLMPFQERTWLTDSVTFADYEDPIEVIKRLFEVRGWTSMRVGIDEDSYCMPIRRFRHLERLLPAVEFVDFSGVLGRLRAVKSPTEISCIRRAAEVCDLAIRDAVSKSGVGTSARDAAQVVQMAFTRYGADSGRFGVITTATGNSFLHGNTQTNPMGEGEVLHIEPCPYVSGYGARLMRPAIIGRPTAEQNRIASRLLAIQDQQFEAMKPGVLACDVDAIARNAVLAEGLRDDYPNITGYTLGYYASHSPHTSDFTHVFLPTSKWVLEPGMVFHMYVSASGLAFSETVLVRREGVELLTCTPRRMFIAGEQI